MKNTILASTSIIICLVMMEFALSLHEKYAYMDAYRPSGDVVHLQGLNYNDTEIAKVKPDDEFRILSFGDSFCHATVSPPFSYNGILESRLRDNNPTVRVVNFGEPLSSIPQYLATLKNWAPQIDHDMILVNIFAINDLGELARNDLEDDLHLNRIMGELFINSQTGHKRLDHVPHVFPLRLMDYLHAIYYYFKDGSVIYREIPPPYTLALGPVTPESFAKVVENDLAVCDKDAQAIHLPALERVKELADLLSTMRKQGKRILILISPSEIQINPALFHETVTRLHRDPNRYDLNLPNAMVRDAITAVDPELEIFDLTPLLRETMAQGVNPYYPLDAHWSAVGNRIVGEALADHLSRP